MSLKFFKSLLIVILLAPTMSFAGNANSIPAFGNNNARVVAGPVYADLDKDGKNEKIVLLLEEAQAPGYVDLWVIFDENKMSANFHVSQIAHNSGGIFWNRPTLEVDARNTIHVKQTSNNDIMGIKFNEESVTKFAYRKDQVVLAGYTVTAIDADGGSEKCDWNALAGNGEWKINGKLAGTFNIPREPAFNIDKLSADLLIDAVLENTCLGIEGAEPENG